MPFEVHDGFMTKDDLLHSSEQIIHEGTRNTSLFHAGCSLRGKGRSELEIFDSLSEMNEEVCLPPLPEREIAQIVRSVARYTPGNSMSSGSVNWFKLGIAEWFSNPNWLRLKDHQKGWYTSLEFRAFMGGGLLPADVGELFALADADSKAKFRREYRDILREYEEIVVDGRPMLLSRRLAAKHAEVEGAIRTKREAGIKSGEIRRIKSALSSLGSS